MSRIRIFGGQPGSLGEKARALGFELLGAEDSPVTGGAERWRFLAWLRFAGDRRRCPPGERRPKPAVKRACPAADAATALPLVRHQRPGLEDTQPPR